VAKTVNVVPVLGGRDKLLAYWAFQMTYNLPLSIHQSLVGNKPEITADRAANKQMINCRK
jgi:hypothetical protein